MSKELIVITLLQATEGVIEVKEIPAFLVDKTLIEVGGELYIPNKLGPSDYGQKLTLWATEFTEDILQTFKEAVIKDLEKRIRTTQIIIERDKKKIEDIKKL